MRQRPNVLLVIPHDIGDYFGCYGREVKTPHLDRFARDGTLFSNHFCTSPLCSPARGSLITGMYPHTNGLAGLVNVGWNLPDWNISDAQRFAKAGYQTYLVGGQHEKISSANLGFDHLFEDADCADGDLGKVVHVTGELLRELGERRSNDAAQPFYMRVGTATAHRRGHADPEIGYFDPPYGYTWARDDGISESSVEVLPQWRDTPRLRDDLRGFTGEITRFDAGLGAIFSALHASGLEEDTIVAVVPDHGIDYPRGKGTLYELGIKTALIIRVPGRSQVSRVAALTSHIDVLPTLLDLCSIGDDLDRIQGFSLVPLLEGRQKPIREEIFAEQTAYHGHRMRCVRTGNYKLIRNIDVGMKSNAPMSGAYVTEGSESHYLVTRPRAELYDLVSDPAELTNLAGDVGQVEIQKELQVKLDCWLNET